MSHSTPHLTQTITVSIYRCANTYVLPFPNKKNVHATKGIPLAILLLYTYFLFYIMYSFTLSRHKHKVLSNNWWCNIVYIRYTFYTTLVYYTNKHLLWLLFMGSRVFNQDILEKKLSISWSAWAHIPILNLIKMLKFAKKSMPYCTYLNEFQIGILECWHNLTSISKGPLELLNQVQCTELKSSIIFKTWL